MEYLKRHTVLSENDINLMCEAVHHSGDTVSQADMEFWARFFVSALDLQRGCLRDNGPTDMGTVQIFMSTDVVHETPPMNHNLGVGPRYDPSTLSTHLDLPIYHTLTQYPDLHVYLSNLVN